MRKSKGRKRKMNKSESGNRGLKEKKRKKKSKLTTTDSCILFLIQRLASRSSCVADAAMCVGGWNR